MVDGNLIQSLQARRREHWGQTPETRTPTPEAASALIERVGIATIFPVSSELPNLLHAYVGNDTEQPTSDWDSSSGHVYTWRWELGRKNAAFYSAIARGRPTLVSWSLLPAVLRLRGDSRTPDELYDTGVLSADAYRIAQALDEASDPLSTGELRQRAGFPTGKSQRAAYLHGVAELESRLLLAKVFLPGGEGEDMHHALVSARFKEFASAADLLSAEGAYDQFLATYLPQAVYVAPKLLARHLSLPEKDLVAALDRLVDSGRATSRSLPGYPTVRYLIPED